MTLLPNIVLRNFINKTLYYSGMDSAQYCRDLIHFNQYPWPVSYQYNSRGFRDQEWPENLNELQECIWCIGDSFTVGIGSPIEHTWTHLLAQATGKRTINISMDGASNNWISRISQDIAQIVQPKNMVIMWSYIHRREHTSDNDVDRKSREVINLSMEEFWKEYYNAIRLPIWPDCANIEDFSTLPTRIKQRIQQHHQVPQFVIAKDLSSMRWKDDEVKRIHYINSLDQQDLENFQSCVDRTKLFDKNINVVHSIIPELSPQKYIDTCGQITNYNNNFVGYFKKLDLARDGQHFDLVTAQSLVDAMSPLVQTE
jgi:hypothetical protein